MTNGPPTLLKMIESSGLQLESAWLSASSCDDEELDIGDLKPSQKS